MKCRCGHDRSRHYQRYGVKRFPCWAVIDREHWIHGDGKRDRTICSCRDFVQEVPK